MLEAIHFHTSPKRVSLAAPPGTAKFTDDDVEAARREGYRRGTEEATRLLEKQMIEQRSEMVALQSETFASLARQHADLIGQVHEVVPQLILEATARVLGGAEFDRVTIQKIAGDLLSEVTAGREDVELQLAPRDLELITGYEESFREKHPAIVFRSNPDLRSGDCVVRSRFGLIDGRLAIKLRALEGFLR